MKRERRPAKDGRHALEVIQFDQFSEAKAYYEGPLGRKIYDEGNSHWIGGTRADLEHDLAHGNTKLVEAAEKVLELINTNLDLEMIAPRYEYTVAGGMVSVPRFLSGSPACMSRQVDDIGDHAPIRVFVGLACSGGIDARTMQTRNAACIALALALSRVRPVELWGYTICDPRHNNTDALILSRIGTSPFDASAAAAQMSILYTRGFLYAASRHLVTGECDENGELGWSRIPEAEAVGATGDDVVVPEVRLYEAAAVAEDPVKWVETRLREALKGGGTAHKSGY